VGQPLFLILKVYIQQQHCQVAFLSLEMYWWMFTLQRDNCAIVTLKFPLLAKMDSTMTLDIIICQISGRKKKMSVW